ncbi:hypothetical protein [Paracnuella aquatica]|uniref:hypothetical protein n=1 Tax=Paracnuella aquatica TaxID=2268757 RepID=UPI000DEFCDF1|nr:hypothetical protein [Paracnuella aquatica]RPD51308.1 hypothetical protein DRJ53_01095 [Paracnuella aquatica]
MKSLYCFLILLAAAASGNAQEFTKQMTTARTAYSSGKLEEARFAMQQMMQELDIISGKELIGLLPAKLDTMSANTSADAVSGTSGFAGVVVHREYGKAKPDGDVPAQVEIITNSPLISGLNAMLSLPLLGNSPDQKVIKISGYKALVTKQHSDGETPEFEVQLPLNSTLITLKAPGYSQEKIIALANTLPIAEIAKRVQ